MAIKPITEQVGATYSLSSFTVAVSGDAFLVKFFGIDFSTSAAQDARNTVIATLVAAGYSVEEDFTDLLVKGGA